jgi:hypothetical protein
MRATTLAAALAAAAALLWGAPAAHAATAKRCAPSGAKTVRSTADVRVYRRNEQKYVCSLRTGTTKRLDSKEESTAYIYDIRGSFVAYEIYVTTRDRSYVNVRTVNARTGRLVVDAEAFTGAYRISRSVEAASRMLLLSGGDVAWISRTGVDDGNREVRFAGAGHPVRVLEAGADIEPDSLAVTPGRAYWTTGGSPRGVRLP